MVQAQVGPHLPSLESFLERDFVLIKWKRDCFGSILKVGWCQKYLSLLLKKRNGVSRYSSVFPSWIFDYFDAVKIEDDEERIDIYLDEKKLIPSEYANRGIIAYGFTNAYVVQDFPIRGKEVYLHLRRRKWMLTDCMSSN